MTAKAVDAPLAGVLAADAQIFYLAWAVAGGMTALRDGALPAFANDVAISPQYVGAQRYAPPDTVISRYLRANLSALSERFTTPDYLQSRDRRRA
jgi:hypothetical protein